MATTERSSPSITAADLHRISEAEALALVERLLGDESQWPSPLIKYRFKSEWQRDWKAELGHWLHTAGTFGFQGQLVDRVLGRARRGSRSTTVDPNDQRHLDLQSEMAPAMVVHYLTGTGWAYRQWEAVTGGNGDVDVEFAAPGGVVINTQVKAPDQPGSRAGGRVVDGEYDDRVLTALRKAAGQLLPFGEATNVIVICARRGWPLSGEPEPLVGYLYGSTLCDRTGRVWLPHAERGWFFTPWWRHIGAVVVLDYVRGVGNLTYGCVVLVNPMADHGVTPGWFPHAHACFLDGNVFRWQNGEPAGHGHTALPEGTLLDA
ncbi:MAG: hypothetical protein JWP01_3963 [Myxococcales bacterium]|nr:hypothetical protein [Myxococcales bacterium]